MSAGTAVAPGAARRERLRPANLRPGDVVARRQRGLRTRPVRVVLSALGIAIGIAAMVAVLGISASSRAELQATLDKLGTNLLTVAPGNTMFGEERQAAGGGAGDGRADRAGDRRQRDRDGDRRPVYRNDRIPAEQTSGIGVLAAQPDLLDTVAGTVAGGTWLNEATARYPAVVLGDDGGAPARDRRSRARTSGSSSATSGSRSSASSTRCRSRTSSTPRPWSAGRWRRSCSASTATRRTVYERSRDDAVDAVRAVLPQTANPEHPEEVEVSRPSDALAAREAADRALTGLLLGLGAVALLVGGVGVANTMVISVLERRNEIGLRRALGRDAGAGAAAVPGRVAAAVRARRRGRRPHRHRW